MLKKTNKVDSTNTYPKLTPLWSLLAGMLLFNAIPHLVNGISGNAFPTPFANPPGKGLSAPEINVIWAFLNLALGWKLAAISLRRYKTPLNKILFVSGAVSISLILSVSFAGKAAL